MLLLRRLLPFLVAIANVFLLRLQASSPATYPWLAGMAPLIFVSAGVCIGWKRIGLAELFAKLLTPTLALFAAGFGLLLAEGALARWLIPLFSGGVSYLALELLFLLTFLPTRYPVNGLSHLNLSLVPAVLWFANQSSVGLTMFVHASRVIPILALAVAAGLLFWATSHVEADVEHRGRWAALGGWIGLHLGILGAFLPVNIALHGSYAALLGVAALRARRYGIAPHLPRGMVWAEAGGVVVLLLAMMITARWI